MSARMREILLLLMTCAAAACSNSDDGVPPAPSETRWVIDNIDSIGGQTPQLLGAPRLDAGAVCFDGVDDALLFPAHPLAGLSAFTLQVRFRPDAGGPAEQRFIHAQAAGSEHRVLIETRVNANEWYLDTYLRSGTTESTLVDPARTHPADLWYWAALSYANGTMRHFVDGTEEASAAIAFEPLAAGELGVGVRLNQMYWFKGCISELRIAAQALPPDQLRR
jgi:hypothetical protein